MKEILEIISKLGAYGINQRSAYMGCLANPSGKAKPKTLQAKILPITTQSCHEWGILVSVSVIQFW